MYLKNDYYFYLPLIMISKVEGYICLSLIYSILLLFMLFLNNLLLYIIPNYLLIVVLEIGIVVIQVDNFSLLYDYKNLKEFYEKLIDDEYRINKLSNISNNLLRRYESLEEDYFNLLSNYDDKKENNKNIIKYLNIQLNNYKSLYLIEFKKTKTINELTRAKSLDELDLKNSLNLEIIDSLAIDIINDNSLNSDSEKSTPTEIFRRTKSVLSELYNECSENNINKYSKIKEWKTFNSI